MKRIVLGLLSLAANVAFSQITIPSITANKYQTINSLYVCNISTKLFNDDADLDFLLSVSFTDSCVSCVPLKYILYNNISIMTESGSSIFKIDSANVAGLNNGLYGYLGILRIDDKYKLMVQSGKKSDGAYMENVTRYPVPVIYSLPGTLPDITTSLNSPDLDKGKAHLSLPIPNPSQDITRIEYQLPTDAAFGEITVYNNMGFKLKSYKVDNTFGDLLLNNQDLPTGQYYYHLVANGKRIGSQKMLVIK